MSSKRLPENILWHGVQPRGRAQQRFQNIRAAHPHYRSAIWVPFSILRSHNAIVGGMVPLWQNYLRSDAVVTYGGAQWINTCEVEGILAQGGNHALHHEWTSQSKACALREALAKKIAVDPFGYFADNGAEELHNHHPYLTRQWIPEHFITAAGPRCVASPTAVWLNGRTQRSASLDQIYNGHTLLEELRRLQTPQIMTVDGELLPPQRVPLELLREMEAQSPEDSLWFVLPTHYDVEGGFEGYPLTLKPEAVVVDVSGLPPETLVSTSGVVTRAIAPLSSIAPDEQDFAEFLHQYRPMTVHGNPWKQCLPLICLAWEKKYKSLIWVSADFVRRYELAPKGDEVAAVELALGSSVLTLMNLDEFDSISDNRWREILLQMREGRKVAQQQNNNTPQLTSHNQDAHNSLM